MARARFLAVGMFSRGKAGPGGVRCAQTGQRYEQVRRDERSEQELLNRLAAIQAAAELLYDNEDLSPRERKLFVLVVRTGTTRLHSIIAG